MHVGIKDTQIRDSETSCFLLHKPDKKRNRTFLLQYCYSKKLHQAASLIQRQFRLYKSTKRKAVQHAQKDHQSDSDSIDSPHNQQPLFQAFTAFLENTAKSEMCMAMSEGTSNRDGAGCCSSCTADDEYWDAKRQQAAMRIQQAFRYVFWACLLAIWLSLPVFFFPEAIGNDKLPLLDQQRSFDDAPQASKASFLSPALTQKWSPFL